MGQALARAPSEQDQREAERQRWLDRANSTLATATDIVQGPRLPDPAFIARHLQAMVENSAGAQCLNREDREMLTGRAKALELTAYERAFEQLLTDGRAAIRSNKKDALAPLLKTATEYAGELRKRGLSAEEAEGLKEKLDILRETTRAGQSEKAKAPEKPDSARAYANDRRMFVRYTDPTLIVEVGGHRFLTIDWSLGGALLGGVERLPAPLGKLLVVRLRVEGGPLHEERATIIRYDPDQKAIAVQFRRFGSTLIAIKRECDALGLEPS